METTHIYYLFVDRNGNEYISEYEPHLVVDEISKHLNIPHQKEKAENMFKRHQDGLYGDWYTWLENVGGYGDCFGYNFVREWLELPKGTIEALYGKKLTIDDGWETVRFKFNKKGDSVKLVNAYND